MSDSTNLPTVEVLDQNSPGSTTNGSRRWPWVAAGVAALAVTGAGIALGMVLSGGGTQPEELVPASAVVYADVDLDPGTGQKVNLLRLLSKFPELEQQLGDRADLKEYVITELVGQVGGVAAAEVSSWVGDRAGVALLWDDRTNEATLAVLVQVTDQSDAEATLSRTLSEDEYAFTSGYVVVTSALGARSADRPLSAEDMVTAGAAEPLADDPAFQTTMEPLGAGIGSVFVDADALAQATEGALGTEGTFGLDSQQVTGHLGAVLRVEPTAIELVARGDQTSTGVFTSPTDVISHLPSSTALAFSFGGGGTAVTEQWESLTRQLAAMAQRRSFDRTVARLEAKYDIRLPADLVTLLGEDAVVAVDGEGLIGSVPRMGLRTVTEPTAAADLVSRLRPTLADLTAGFDITMEPVDDGLVVATTPEFADVLVNGPGGLLTDPGFVAAVPDATDASAVMWLDLAALGDAAALFDPSVSSMLKPLAGLGVSGGVRDDGQFLTMRLTFQED